MKRKKIQKRSSVSNDYLDRGAGKQFFPGQQPASRPFFSPAGKQPHQFVPGRPEHKHPPLGNWAIVQAASKATCQSSQTNMVDCTCASSSPADVINAAYNWEMMRSPLAKEHLNHYLSGGGTDFNEDKNLYDLLVQDEAVRSKFGNEVHARNVGNIPIWQGDYTVEDFRLAFGGIDRVDFEVHTLEDTVDIWFIDMYEFHPVGFGHQNMGTGDVLRSTNCVHAAAVEMKSQSATDFWMKGKVTVPLSWLLTSRGGNNTGGGDWW